MSKVILVVHECYAGKQKAKELFAAAIVNCCCIGCMMKGWFCPNTVTTKKTPERISLSGVM